MAVVKHSLQDEFELAAFMSLLKREGVRSYLEIGSNAGGTLRWVATALEKPSVFVSVDNGANAESKISLTRAINYLNLVGHRAQIFWGDSTDKTIIEQVRHCGPFDCVFIDANHTLSYLSQDWEHYGPMGRMVCFHDIAWRRSPDWKEGQRIDVPQFWEVVKGLHRHEEITFDPTRKNNGIGVLWR